MSGAQWKNSPMTPQLWPWPIIIILHDICVAIPDLTKKVENLIREMSGAPWKNGTMTPKLWPYPILIILHDICVAIPDSTKFDQKSEKFDKKNEWGPMKKWSYNFETLAVAFPHHITRYMCCDPRFDQIWPK